MERKKKTSSKVVELKEEKKPVQTGLGGFFSKKETPRTSSGERPVSAEKGIMDDKPEIKTATPKDDKSGAKPKERFVRLNRDFFKDEVVSLSRKLLGKVIRRNVDGKILRVRIVETEAYKAPEDKACHAYNNKKTERTKVFWNDAGCWYVYTIYMKTNMCLNVVAADKDIPEATLIRAGEPLEGIGEMQKYRSKEGKNTAAQLRELTNGPGKLGQALGMTLSHSGHDMCSEGYEEAYIEDDTEFEVKDEDIGISKRINIDYAEEYKDKPWRFFLKNNPYVSKV